MSSFFHNIGAKIVAVISGIFLLFSGSHTAAIPPVQTTAAVTQAIATQTTTASPSGTLVMSPSLAAVYPATPLTQPASTPIPKVPSTPSASSTKYVTQAELTKQLNDLRNVWQNSTLNLGNSGGGIPPATLQAFAASQRIDSLTNTTITNPIITNARVNGVSGLTDADIPDDITTNPGALKTSFAVAAGQNINAGDFVSLNSDGTVQKTANSSLIYGASVVATSSASTVNITTLDSTHFALMYLDGTNGSKTAVQACSTSGTTPTCTTGVIATSSTNSAGSITTLDSTHVALTYRDSTTGNKLSVQACSISGTTMTCGTGLLATSSTNSPLVAPLDSTHLAFLYNDSTNSNKTSVQACSVSGITVTCGAGLLATSSTDTNITITNVDSTHFAIAYTDSTNSSKTTIQACSVSGTTVSCGIGTVATSSVSGSPKLLTLDSTHVELSYRANANSSKLTTQICSISGVTVSCGVDVTISNTNGGFVSTVLDSTHYAFAYANNVSNNAHDTSVCTVSGITVSCTTELQFSFNSAANVPVISTLDPTHYVVGYVDSSNNSKMTSTICVVSGSSVSCPLNEIVSISTNAPIVATLDSTHFVFVYTNTTNGNLSTIQIGQLNSSSALSALGVANTAALAGQSVAVIYQGVAGGFSGLTIGAIYYANTDGTATTTITPNLLGMAISASQILFNSNYSNRNTLTQFFGDAVFLNDFRITESLINGKNGLLFKNQNGDSLANLDEAGNFWLKGNLNSSTMYGSDSTTTVAALLDSAFAGAGESMRAALNSIGDTVVRILGDTVYATRGIFGAVFANLVHTDTLCVGSTCVTQTQLQALLDKNGIESASSTVFAPSVSTTTETATSSEDIVDEPVATSTDPVFDLTPPVVETSTSTPQTTEATSTEQ